MFDTTDDVIGAFLYALTLIRVNDDGLIPGALDDADTTTIGTLAAAAYQIAERGETPRDLALGWLAATTGALLASQWIEGETAASRSLVREWLTARAEELGLRLTAG